MTLQEICLHERAGMHTRRLNGYAQHDDHVWRWLNAMLKAWGEAHPFKVNGVPIRARDQG